MEEPKNLLCRRARKRIRAPLLRVVVVHVFLLSAFLFNTSAASANAYPSEWFQGARAGGIGNAVTAIPEGVEGLLYNPALIGRNDKVKLSLFRPAVSINQGALNYALDDVTFNNDTSDKNLLQQDMETLMDNPLRAKINIVPMLQLGPVALGMFALSTNQVFALNQSFPRLNVEAYVDYGFLFGFGHQFEFTYKNRLEMGVMFKNMWRRGIYLPNMTIGQMLDLVSGQDIDSDFIEDLDSIEHAFGADFGMLWSHQLDKRGPTQHGPWPKGSKFLTLGFSWQNIGDTNFGSPDVPGAFPSIKQQMNLGVGYSSYSTLFDFKLSAELRHINQNTATFAQKIHAGMELAIPFNTFRVGVMSRKLALGYSFRFLFGSVTASTWVEDFSASPGINSDRFYMIEIDLMNPDMTKRL